MVYDPQYHHRKSIRLKGHDYGSEGFYFLTICVQDRVHLFGKIVSGKMELNDAGKIAQQCWLEIPGHFPNVVLHDFVIMPNHIHGIIEIVGAEHFPPKLPNNDMEHFPPKLPNNDMEHFPPKLPNNDMEHFPPKLPNNDMQHFPPKLPDGDSNEKMDVEHVASGLPNYVSNHKTGAENVPPLRGPSKTVGSIVRGFKIGVTKWVRSNTNIRDVWQRNYYEHIIRDQKSFDNISGYIHENPEKWESDQFRL